MLPFMEMLALPNAIQPSCLNCGITGSSKLVVAKHNIHGEEVKLRLAKPVLKRKLICNEVKKIITTRSPWTFRSHGLGTSCISGEQTKKEPSSYLFRTEIEDGLVKVVVQNENNKYGVSIEVSSLRLCTSTDKLVLSWGVFRSDSSCFMPVDMQGSAPNGMNMPIETPFDQSYAGKSTLELEFGAKQTPFYISFLLKSYSGAKADSIEIKSHRNANFCVPVGFTSGFPAPLGLSFANNRSMNFAVFSRNAETVVLCLYDEGSANQPALELDLDPYVNRTGDIWHASMNTDVPYVLYGYRCKGKKDNICPEYVLLDPYAKIIEKLVSDSIGSVYLGRLQKNPDFDWSGDVRPCLPMEKLIVYRLKVSNFTMDKSSKLAATVAGSFSGLTEKVHHFKDIGANAVLLEPVFPFDEKKGPYFPCHFFSPTGLYGVSGDPVLTTNSFKEMVKRLHSNGIEVMLEVVFTHTANEEEVSLRAIDTPSYYSGSSNALNCNHPIVQQLIMDSLRHWVVEFRIDGFCFINASSLLMGIHGENLSRPPLIEAIAFDPILSKTKLIADAWDPHDMLPKQTRFPHWKIWAEMNSNFCKDARNFLQGEGRISDLATRLCGSGDIFSDGRGPSFSFNFIARSSGFSLVDLVSFSSSSELSWNCGEEGLTNKPAVLERRLRQIRNFLFILYLSLGIPVMNMGDESGRSSCDGRPFNWNALIAGFAIQTVGFIGFLSLFRARRGDIFQRKGFLRAESIEWHGTDGCLPGWDDPSSKFLAMRLVAGGGGEGEVGLESEPVSESETESSSMWGDLFMVFSAGDCSEAAILPPPPVGMSWHRLVDTSLSFPGFFSRDGGCPVHGEMDGSVKYRVEPHSCALFEARSTPGL